MANIINFPIAASSVMAPTQQVAVPASQLPITVVDNVGVILTQSGSILTINPTVVPPPPTPTITGVHVTGAAALTEGNTAQYTAVVTGTGAFSSAVTWKASDGTITASGVFTAPLTVENVTITATSTQDATKFFALTVAISNATNTTKVQASGGDDTAALQAALNTAANAGKILEMTTAGGTWHVNPLTIPSGTNLLIDSGALITDQKAYSSNACMFNINTSNVTITANGAFAQMPLSLAQSKVDGQEYRHCVVIGQGSAAANVTVTGLTVNSSGGDGLYIRNSTNVTINNMKVTSCFRNGCSITGAVNGVTFNTFTSSTNLRAGFDFEPNTTTDFLMNIVLNNVETDNNPGGGMSFGPYSLDATSKPVTITVNGFASTNDAQYGIFFTNGNYGNTPSGSIVVNNATITNPAFGGAYGRYAASGPQITFNNLKIANSNRKGTDPHYAMNSACGVELTGGQTGPCGGATFNIASITNTNGNMVNYFQTGNQGPTPKNASFTAPKGSLSGATNKSAITQYP